MFRRLRGRTFAGLTEVCDSGESSCLGFHYLTVARFQIGCKSRQSLPSSCNQGNRSHLVLSLTEPRKEHLVGPMKAVAAAQLHQHDSEADCSTTF